MNWDGTPDRPIEWNSKTARRCYKCKRLGHKEFYEGVTVGGEKVYRCIGKCKPIDNSHLDNARGPKDVGEDPPRVPYVEPVVARQTSPQVKRATTKRRR